MHNYHIHALPYLSNNQIKNVVIDRMVIWLIGLSNPSDAIKLSCFLITRSTANPIRISGIISNNLFIIEQNEAQYILDLHGRVYRMRSLKIE